MRLHKKQVRIEPKPYVVQKRKFITLPGSNDFWDILNKENGILFLNSSKTKIALYDRKQIFYADLEGVYMFRYVPVSDDYSDFEGYFIEVDQGNKYKTIRFDENLNKLGETIQYDGYSFHKFTKEGLELELFKGDALLETVLGYDGKFIVKEELHG